MATVNGEYVGPLDADDCRQIVDDVKAGRPVLSPSNCGAADGRREPGGEPGVMQLLFDGIDEPGLHTLEVYRRERGGYEMLERALKMDSADILEQVKAAGLRGRGGAGFPTGTKWSFIPKARPSTSPSTPTSPSRARSRTAS